MTGEALADYQRARERQLSKNEARHIYTKVREARESPQRAGVRWPFELLQNALDVGPRAGRDVVTVHLTREDGRTIFEHDGAPFSSQELAALLSGGSSKDFGSTDTTGRFGTGFLVTHVLADRMSLEGLMAVGRGNEFFCLDLDRSGDEEEILENIHACGDAIEQAKHLENVDDVASARFIYPIRQEDTFATGMEAFRVALPYLYGTCPQLGEVHLSSASLGKEVWTPADVLSIEIPGGVAWDRLIEVHRAGTINQYRILRFAITSDSRASALVCLESIADRWRIRFPSKSDPRIYRQYPLRSSSFVPIRFIIDGLFEPDQERSVAYMTESDKSALEEALAAGVAATRYTFAEGFISAHLLAEVDSVDSAFNPADPDEISWWSQALGKFAEAIGGFPIVQTTSEVLPALPSDEAYADFISPYLLAGSAGGHETSVDRLWPLLEQTTDLRPPTSELASDWTEIADGWARLEVHPNRITVESLAGWVRGTESADTEAAEISELRVTGDKIDWLARYIDVIGECWQNRGGIDASILRKMLPNQHGILCSPEKLRRDEHVSEGLKEICSAVGLDVRSGLLSKELTDCIVTNALQYARPALEKAITGAANSDDIERELLEYLMKLLPEDSTCSEENSALWHGTASFFEYLWVSHGLSAATLAHKVPLAAKSKKVAYWSSERMMMAPVSTWGETAQAFSDAYPADRILDDSYANKTVVEALTRWGIAYADPIILASVSSLDGTRLAAMVEQGFDSGGVVVRDQQFSQIALLPREVMLHIQDQEQARALLGLVLMHVAPNDARWRQWLVVNGSKAGDPEPVRLRGALWLGDLRSRAWVPVRGDDESKPVKAGADAVTLRSLLDPAWIEGNPDAIDLLTQCFEFDELELRLLGIGPGAQGRVRQGLAKLLESGGADPEFYEDLAREVEERQQRKEDVNRARRMGLIVQEAVQCALESYGLTVKVVDVGYDFEVTGSIASDTLELVASHFEVGPYLVEVKATTAGPVRLTPAQAGKAGSEFARFVLCVVDLRDLRDDGLDQEWSEVDVTSRIVMLSYVGNRVLDTYQLVQLARQGDVGIRNDSALRYEVPPQIWKKGVGLSEWVASIASDPAMKSDSQI
jgi:hypothetical protein